MNTQAFSVGDRVYIIDSSIYPLNTFTINSINRGYASLKCERDLSPSLFSMYGPLEYPIFRLQRCPIQNVWYYFHLDINDGKITIGDTLNDFIAKEATRFFLNYEYTIFCINTMEKINVYASQWKIDIGPFLKEQFLNCSNADSLEQKLLLVIDHEIINLPLGSYRYLLEFSLSEKPCSNVDSDVSMFVASDIRKRQIEIFFSSWLYYLLRINTRERDSVYLLFNRFFLGN